MSRLSISMAGRPASRRGHAILECVHVRRADAPDDPYDEADEIYSGPGGGSTRPAPAPGPPAAPRPPSTPVMGSSRPNQTPPEPSPARVPLSYRGPTPVVATKFALAAAFALIALVVERPPVSLA